MISGNRSKSSPTKLFWISIKHNWLRVQVPVWPPSQREAADAAPRGSRRPHRHSPRHRPEGARGHYGHILGEGTKCIAYTFNYEALKE